MILTPSPCGQKSEPCRLTHPYIIQYTDNAGHVHTLRHDKNRFRARQFSSFIYACRIARNFPNGRVINLHQVGNISSDFLVIREKAGFTAKRV